MQMPAKKTDSATKTQFFVHGISVIIQQGFDGAIIHAYLWTECEERSLLNDSH